MADLGVGAEAEPVSEALPNLGLECPIIIIIGHSYQKTSLSRTPAPEPSPLQGQPPTLKVWLVPDLEVGTEAEAVSEALPEP